MRPCGSGSAPPAAPAAGLSRCHVRPQRRGAGPGTRPAGGAERAERSCRLPSSAARRAAPSTPPPATAASPSSSPWPGAVAPLRCGVLRSLALRLLPPPGAARAVQVTALPRKREAERGAPGFPGPLPAPRAARAGPRTRDAPPRGTVRTAGRPYTAPARGKGDRPLPGSGTRTGALGGWSKSRYAPAF